MLRHHRLLFAATLSVALVVACAREFRNERETVAHFTRHRADFERVVELFAQQSHSSVEIPEQPSSKSEPSFVTLGRQLRITSVDAVPGVKPKEQQWIELTLASHLSMSSYGVLYVPPHHDEAFATIAAFRQSLPLAMSALQPIDGRWFYYEYK
jgi:hypothetical protein